MSVELGKYAAEVSAAYGASMILLLGLIIASLRASGRARRALDALEKAAKDG